MNKLSITWIAAFFIWVRQKEIKEIDMFIFLLLVFVKVGVIEQAKKTWQKEVDKYILNSSRLIY